MELWTEIFVKTVDATWKMDKDFQDHVLIADERRSNQKSQRQYVNSAIRNSRQTRRWFSIKEILVISHPHRRRSEMTELTKEGKRFVNCKYQIPECRCCHSTDYGVCQDYLSQDEKSEDGMCVYCDHHKKCHVLADEKSYNTPL